MADSSPAPDPQTDWILPYYSLVLSPYEIKKKNIE